MTEKKKYAKPLPNPTPLTQPFWDACKRHELVVQKCRSCNKLVFPPQPTCTGCFSTDLGWEVVSGKGKIYSYSIVHRPQTPDFEVPYVVIIVLLDEGPHMLGNLEGSSLEDVRIDMPVEVFFDDVTKDFTLFKFKPRVE